MTVRAFSLVLGIIGQLDVQQNWHRIYREAVYGDPPVSERGRQDAAFLSHQAGTPAAR